MILTIHGQRRKMSKSVNNVCVWTMLCLVVHASAALAQDGPERKAVETLGYGAGLELFLLVGAVPGDSSYPSLTWEKSCISTHLCIWRGRSGAHGPNYTVAWDGERIYRLGGFAAPEVYAFSQVLPGDVTTSAQAARRARTLLRYTSTGDSIWFPGQKGQGGALPPWPAKVWEYNLPELNLSHTDSVYSSGTGIVSGWGAHADTAFTTLDSGFIVIVSSLTGYQEGRSFTYSRHVFWFDRRGAVLAWTFGLEQSLKSPRRPVPNEPR